jgi:hypothetical protein
MDAGRGGPSGGSGSVPPGDPTQPIRPSQAGTEPIPERMRQPVVVPRSEPTIAGLPRGLVVAGAIFLGLALLGGFLIGRAAGGDEDPQGVAPAGRRAACARALELSLQVVQLQEAALTNRTEAIRALIEGDRTDIQRLSGQFDELSQGLTQAHTRLSEGIERCRKGRPGKSERRNRGGGEGG